MVLDTGSELSWLRCRKTPTTPLWFDSLRSKSYTPVPCTSPTCRIRTRDFTVPVSCDRNKLCHAIVSYADATSVEGNLAYDVFRFTNSDVPRIVFGCMDSGSSSNQDEDSKTTGLLDSGTQFTFLLGPVYTALKNEFIKQTRSVLRVFEDPDFVFQGAMDLCYRIDRTRVGLPVLPSVTMMFRGAQMSITGDRLLVQVPGLIKGNDQIHCFTFGNSDLLGIEAYVIGHHHQQNMWMEFDIANSRVGLAEVRCDLASQKLGMGR
ncbi:hypothetical protein E3N88_23681 [Mikania micrantha]|uniref:Peptidase A1 domain-containing protein n=1 Tax=Mikania micrantha TaxID=192012 RepID=A0A5N6NFK9_9ASTR|nr:hypothetical protein E3N88_23681 [Mikania micrantha]